MSANPARRIRRRALHARNMLGKPRGTWGWRVAHGARVTTTTARGGRAAVAAAQAQRHATGRLARRKHVARRIREAS